MKNKMNRRGFLGTCGKMTSLPVAATLLQMKMTNSVLAQSQFSDYKAIVCVFLGGGNDSFNMLLPRVGGEYQRYAEARRHVAIGYDSLLPIIDRNNSRKHYGVTPLMPEVQTMYNNRQLSFIANVGSLYRPMSLQDYQRGIHRPRGLFSHFEQTAAWQTSIADRLTSHGWMGRMQDVMRDDSSFNSAVSLNISASENNRAQTGQKTSPYVIGSGLGGYNGVLKDSVDLTMEQRYSNLLADQYAFDRKKIIEQTEVYQKAMAGVSLKTSIGGMFGPGLTDVAKTIARRKELGHTRQTFFVRATGFDSHANLLGSHAEKLPQVSRSLADFHKALIELGVDNNVITYTASDFGRSLSPNSTGTDHGWGGNQIVMGAPVRGGRIFGSYPTDLSLGSATDVGRGRQLPTTSCDQFHAEMANWFGIGNNADMETVFPNIRHFWSRGAAHKLRMFSGY